MSKILTIQALGQFWVAKTYSIIIRAPLYASACVCASIRNEVFRAFSTLSYIETSNFPWRSSESSHTSSSLFIVVTPMVMELRALGYSMRHMHVTVSSCFFYTSVSYKNLKLSMRFFLFKSHIDSHFDVVTPIVPDVRALGFFTMTHGVCCQYIHAFITNNHVYNLLSTNIIHHHKRGL
jgi:hypothetical protein